MPLINMPKLSDTMTEGTIARWKKKKGDVIESGDVLAEIETDKATMEMEAFDDGILTEIFVPEGESAAVGTRIALILGEGESAETTEISQASPSSPTLPAATAAQKQKTPAPPTAAGERVKASPLAKKLAAERGVSLSGISGTGPGGRIVARDVHASATGPAAAPAPAAPLPVPKPGAGDQRLPVSNMRKVIAERLLASKTQIPHFYLSIEVDAAALSRVRKELNVANESAGLPKLTVNDFILLAVSRAVESHPAVNASWAVDAIIQYAGVHIAVAVSVEDGLLTPVLRDAQNLNLREISARVKDLAARARDKKLKPEEFQGGTITVSNLGAFGVGQFYAILNPPQAVILAIGAIVKKPVVNAAGEVVVGERMSIGLSGDHRVVDGAVAAQFLAALRRLLENPALLLF